MNKTKIEWVKNPDGTQGYTWNPITGCLNHNNGLCLGGMFPCYAYKLANGRLRNLILDKTMSRVKAAFHKGNCLPPMSPERAYQDPFYPRFWAYRLNELRTDIGLMVPWTKDRGIFVCDMSDLFGDVILREWQEMVFESIKRYSWHRFYLLTKQPQNLIKFSPFPDNCWVGVTVTGHDSWCNAIRYLHDDFLDASVKYISVEPLLSRIFPPSGYLALKAAGIDLVIIGAQTKPYKPPRIEWIEDIVRACDKAGIPVFLKNNLKPLLENDHRAFMNPLYWRDGYYTSPEHPNIDLHLRQEMPD